MKRFYNSSVVDMLVYLIDCWGWGQYWSWDDRLENLIEDSNNSPLNCFCIYLSRKAGKEMLRGVSDLVYSDRSAKSTKKILLAKIMVVLVCVGNKGNFQENSMIVMCWCGAGRCELSIHFLVLANHIASL